MSNDVTHPLLYREGKDPAQFLSDVRSDSGTIFGCENELGTQNISFFF